MPTMSARELLEQLRERIHRAQPVHQEIAVVRAHSALCKALDAGNVLEVRQAMHQAASVLTPPDVVHGPDAA